MAINIKEERNLGIRAEQGYVPRRNEFDRNYNVQPTEYINLAKTGQDRQGVMIPISQSYSLRTVEFALRKK